MVVYLVFSHARLMEKDMRDFARFFRIAGLSDRVRYVVGLKFEPQPESVLILDESDELFYQDPWAFIKLTRARRCICLTATIGGSLDGGAELNLLKNLNFKVFHAPDMRLGIEKTKVPEVLKGPSQDVTETTMWV